MSNAFVEFKEKNEKWWLLCYSSEKSIKITINIKVPMLVLLIIIVDGKYKWLYCNMR